MCSMNEFWIEAYITYLEILNVQIYIYNNVNDFIIMFGSKKSFLVSKTCYPPLMTL